MAIPITRPVMGDSEISAIAAVLDSGYLVQGAQVAEFERLVADHVGTTHAVAVSNCTAALRVALLALGTRPGDRVIVAPYSWVATANVIELCGATPVFVDIDPATFNLDATLLRERLELLSRSGEIDTVRAIMPVHTFGTVVGIGALAEIAAQYAVPLIEDAACALGAHENGRPAGSIGAIGCFSFHPRKIITTGEGGMIVTDDQHIADFARTFRNHGQQVVEGSVEFVMAGDNLRLTDVQGAIGVAQMARLAGLIEARSSRAARYDAMVEPLGFVPQQRGDGAAVQSYVVLSPPGLPAGEVIGELRSRGIEATVGTNAIPFTRFYAERYGIDEGDLPHTTAVGARAVTLPLFPQMSDADQDIVVRALAEIAQVVAR